MTKVRSGDLDRLAALFERHSGSLFGYYVRLTSDRQLSEDFVQETFLRILKYRATYRGEGQFTTWMYSIARNVQIDHYRKWNREERMADEQEIADESGNGAAMENREDVELLQRALERLPADKREIIVLSKYQDLKYSVIAELLGCSEENVKVRVHRAIAELRKIFMELSGETAS